VVAIGLAAVAVTAAAADAPAVAAVAVADPRGANLAGSLAAPQPQSVRTPLHWIFGGEGRLGCRGVTDGFSGCGTGW
jgi:hypothetical protein